MTSIRPLVCMLAFLLLTACDGNNPIATDATDQVIEETPTTSPNDKAPRIKISAPSSSVKNATITTTSVSEPQLLEYEMTKIPESFAEVTAAVENFVSNKNLNGAGLIVVDRDHGVRYHNHWGEFSNDRISLIASTSKVVSAGVLVHLHDRGLLDLEAPISDVVNYAGRLGNITSAQLLSGSSGIPGLRADDALYICMFLPTTSLQKCASDGLSIAASDPRTVPPDSQFRYGGISWQIAGAVAEVASGKSWSELIHEIYVEPCGLKSFGYNSPWIPLRSISGAYPDWDGDLSLLPPTDNPHIGGGAYATTGDYGKLLSMHLNDGTCNGQQVLSGEGVAVMQQNRSGEMYDSFIGYGLGWWTKEFVNSGGAAPEASRDPGPRRLRDPGLYGSTAWIQPDDGFGVYLIVESTSDIGNQLAEQLYPLIESAVVASND